MQTKTEYKETEIRCTGCKNHCRVQEFAFANGSKHYSGNNCERVYSNHPEGFRRGTNLFAEKYKMLFNPARVKNPESGLTIGIPRALGMYEDYPFWQVLFAHCGIRTVLSPMSTNAIYEPGIRSIMAENICFPAKLMHGHILWLCEHRVDRIFYPWVVYEQKEDAESKNSYNCPVVSGYSDVIRSSINPEKKFGIPLDSPIISFKEESLLRAAIREYLATLGIEASVAEEAVTEALAAKQQYLNALEQRNKEVYELAQKEGRLCLMLAARPYHTDPLIQHKIADAVSSMGVDVLTENLAQSNPEVYEDLNACRQWAYPNRIFKAAEFVATHSGVEMVQLTSFGCGPDAFILDEVRTILARKNKNLTILKLDDVNNIGSLTLRVRSLVESVRAESPKSKVESEKSKAENHTTAIFEAADRRRTLLAPYFAEGYNDIIPTLMGMTGYRCEQLPLPTEADAEEGLRDANNDVCYPATLVIGSLLRALRSGKYDPKETAVLITQTGGQCRASNYYALIKNGLVEAGFADVPVVAMGLQTGIRNNQPGFEINWRKVARPAVEALHYVDALHKLYYPSIPREKTHGMAHKLYRIYLENMLPLLSERQYGKMHRMITDAAKAFTGAIDVNKEVPQVGLVGEIYVKYNPFSNHGVVRWLTEHGVEVVPPAITGFFSTAIPNARINRQHHIKTEHTPLWVMRLMHLWIRQTAKRYDRCCKDFPFYRPFADIDDIQRLSQQVINPAADFGEGWFLPGEICHLAENGIKKVVSIQPFGCIANHIISKGIERKFDKIYPDLSLLYLDFDAGTSDANVQNRLHFLIN